MMQGSIVHPLPQGLPSNVMGFTPTKGPTQNSRDLDFPTKSRVSLGSL